MRIDKWLSSTNVVKRRTVATDMLHSGVVYINGTQVKASKNVVIGDKVSLKFLNREEQYEVLDIPTTKSIPKSDKEKYVKYIQTIEVKGE
jgi:ribosomal 50S subunit-recycling heat shock protein